MNPDYYGLSPQMQALVDSETPDWSTVTLDNVHDAVNSVKCQLADNSRYRKKPAGLERHKKLGRYITMLMRVKAAKWAERGEDALADAITRTRRSLRQTDRLGLYSELYLDYLIAEGEKLYQKQPEATDNTRK